ncbi:hypothetical protein ACFRAE_04875 [Sphingobacterium sp. HJSM2_6]|uniref:hypothetical protein n=1 Tax=Sphingobacterium sp. HJSM2_6 TaxID=3366264 RepID=UPI003BCE29FD
MSSKLKIKNILKFGLPIILFLIIFKLTNICRGNEQDSIKNWMYICNSNTLSGNSIDTIYQIGSYLLRLPNETKIINYGNIKNEGNPKKDTIFEKLWRIEVIDMSNDSIYVFNDNYINPKYLNKNLLNTSELIGFNIFQFKNFPEKLKTPNYKLEYIGEITHKNKKCIELQFNYKNENLLKIILDQSLNTPFDIDLDLEGKGKLWGAIVELNYISEGKSFSHIKIDYVNKVPKEKISLFRKLLKYI